MDTQLHFPTLLWSDMFDGVQATSHGPGISHHTTRAYRRLSADFGEWCMSEGERYLPASSDTVARYLTVMGKRGLRISTLRSARSAIAYVHCRTGHEDPTEGPLVTDTLRALKEADGRSGASARPLTQAEVFAIRESACDPRGISGMAPRKESTENARERGLVDIALVSLMREMGLRGSEAAELRWGDVRVGRDGDPTVVVRGDERVSIGEACSRDLEAIRPVGDDPERRVFGLSPGQVGRRIRAAAMTAGLGDGYTGQSCRIGMAQDMAREGRPIGTVMEAGRWRSPRVPTRYMATATA